MSSFLLQNASGYDTSSPIISDPEAVAHFLSMLECPVCFNYILPPILQCSQGHLVCVSCRVRMEKCPICRETLTDIRNLVMEKFATTLLFPCAHKNNGCKLYIPCIEKFQHEKLCPYRMYECPLPEGNCEWTGSRRRLLYHLLEEHSRIAIWQNGEIISLINLCEPGIAIHRNNVGVCTIQIDYGNIENCENTDDGGNYALAINENEGAVGGDGGLNNNGLNFFGRRDGIIIDNQYTLCNYGENEYFFVFIVDFNDNIYEILMPKIAAFRGEDMSQTHPFLP